MKKNTDKHFAISLIVLVAVVGVGSLWIENPLAWAIIVIVAGLSIYLLAKIFLWIRKIL